MNFEFTEEQKLFADSVRKFAQAHLEKDALKRAHDPRFPFDVAKLMHQQGLMGITIPESDGGQGGTLITYTPQNGIQLAQSLAVPIVATAGTTVSFTSILQNAFGTSSPGFTSITLLPSPPFTNTSVDTGYWGAPNITPTWLVNGIPISGRTRVTDISQVSLVVGNQIIDPASFEAVVTAATSGPQSETITYSAWSVDPAVVDRAVADAIAETGATSAKDMGRVMKAVMTRLVGQNVDGKTVNELVRKKLGS